MLNRNDLKCIFAVARNGSTLAAARTLKINLSTVQRPQGEFMDRLRLRLVERSPSGQRLTAAGKAVLASAEAVGVAVDLFEQESAAAARARFLRLSYPPSQS